MVEETTAKQATTLDLPLVHSQINNGSREAPNTPAVI
jgi:hypothetical protein